jgi:hypothetical protein
MLEAFAAGVSPLRGLVDSAHAWPFANLELRQDGRKVRKAHGIRGARGHERGGPRDLFSNMMKMHHDTMVGIIGNIR